MRAEERWQRSARCQELSPSEADALFFPGSGGKPGKAKSYCAGCPVQRVCLDEAIVNRYQGFWSGTTDSDRMMMSVMNIAIVNAMIMPPEPTDKEIKQRVKPVGKVVTISHLWLDFVEPDDTEIFAMEKAAI